jgi:DNA-binding transcriptional regulator YdaS (Cro superfamily)
MSRSSKRDAVILLIAEKKFRKAISEKCKISIDAIKQWRRVPTARVIAVERITGIPRHLIRQDIYPDPSEEKQNEATAPLHADRLEADRLHRTGRSRSPL